LQVVTERNDSKLISCPFKGSCKTNFTEFLFVQEIMMRISLLQRLMRVNDLDFVSYFGIFCV